MEYERLFSGRLNTDDEERVIPNGDFADCSYLRDGSAESGLAGIKSSFSGNTILDFGDGFLPAGTNTLCGSCEATDINSILYLYHNSNEEHSLVIYNTIDDIWLVVMQTSVFRLDLNYPNYDMSYMNGLVRLTDGKDSDEFFTGQVVDDPLEDTRLFNPPLRINVQTGIDGGYTTIDLRSIEVLKWPPWYPPAVEYISVADVPNKIRKGLYEFIQCNGYADDEWSAWGPVSDIPYPTVSDLVSGIDYTSPFVDNCIQVTYDSGPYRVRKIRLAYRVNGGLFYRFVEIDKDLQGIPDNSQEVYQFLNNTVDIVVTEGGGIAPPSEQRVPQTTSCAEMLPTNQDCFGNFYEGYDNVEVDFTLSNRAIEITDYKEDYVNIYITNSVGGFTNVSIQFDSYTFFDISAGDIYTLVISTVTPVQVPITLSYTITQDDVELALVGATPADQLAIILEIIGDAFVAEINAALGLTVTGSMTSATVYQIDVSVGPVALFPIARSASDPVIPARRDNAIQCCHWGWIYYLGLIYRDRGNRDGTVQAPDTIRMLKIPFPSEEAARAAFANPNSPYYNLIRMEIDSLPPIWADTYSVCVKKVATNFQMRTITNIQIDPNAYNTINFTLENFYEPKYKANVSGSIQAGDMVRFVTKNKSSDLQNLAEYMDEYLEFEILGVAIGGAVDGGDQFSTTKFDINALLNENTSYTPENTTHGQLVEIYTPRKIEDEGVWFIIETFGIGKAHTNDRYHTGSLELGGNVSGSATDDYWWFQGDMNGVLTVGQLISVVSEGITYTGVIESISAYNIPFDATRIILSAEGRPNADNLTGQWFYNYSQVIGVSPAIINLNWGDVTYRQRDMGTGFTGSGQPTHSYSYCLDPSRSDYWISNFPHYGQPVLENSENRRIHRETGILHSQKYLADTNINGLSNFTGLNNSKSLSQRWGGITRMKVDKQTLHCVLPRVTFPVYLNGTYATTQSGDEAQPAFSTVTFGGIGQEVSYGSVHKGSVVLRKGGVVMFYDYYNSAVVELTDGGSFDITDSRGFKFKKGIMELTSLIEEDFVTYENSVFAVEDKANSEYILSAWDIGVSTPPRWGAVFNYTKRKWDYRVDYPLIWGQNLGTFLTSTDGERIYKHNEGNDAEFYGVAYNPSIKWPMNAEPSILKRAYALGIKSNQTWNVTDITIAPSGSYPSGMSSRIPAAKFVLKEQWPWAEYLKDQSNVVTGVPHLADAQLALVNGRELRGPSWMHTMEIEITERVTLASAKVVFDLSLQSK